MEQETARRAAQSLNTEFRRRIRMPCTEAIRTYRLIAPGDRIAVCVSGGKDSMLLAVLLRELSVHGEIPFSVVCMAMDPGYSPANRAKLEENAKKLGLSLQIFETDVFRVAAAHGKHPCFLCAKMRRGWLYAQAKKLGCGKIALGHHYDDAVETTLMAMLYGGQVQAMLPRLQSAHFPGMELIRPLYLVREQDIRAWAAAMGLTFLDCACAVTKRKASGSKRAEVKRLIAELSARNPQIKQNILNSVKGVRLDQLLGYRTASRRHSFMERFAEQSEEIREE